MRFLVTTKCRANGRFIAAGEILDTSTSDESTLRALNDGGRGRFLADEERPATTEKSSAVQTPTEPTVESEPEAAEPTKKRGRPRKE